MRVTVATFQGMPPEFGGNDRMLLEKLRDRDIDADYVPWDEAGADWSSQDLVVARSPWDYALRHDEFIGWVRSVRAPLENDPALIEWNSDKRYMGDLRGGGVAVVETAYVAPGDPIPAIEREVVIKPTISAGARDTGHFGPESAAAGRDLIARIQDRGSTAMVQPYVPTVETTGETAVVTFAGEISHVLHKRAVLGRHEVAPIREDDELRVAESMYDPDLVLAGEADEDELALARRTLEAIERRFSATPLVARIDMLRDESGAPILLELEAIEPNLYFEQAPGAADRLADAIVARAAG